MDGAAYLAKMAEVMVAVGRVVRPGSLSVITSGFARKESQRGLEA